MDRSKEIQLLAYLLENIEIIEEYCSGHDEEAFLRDGKTRDAVLTRLIVLGEYSIRLDDELKERFSEVQWQLIKAARNYYAHVYNGIDWLRVWSVVENELPGLKSKIENIIVILEKE